MVEHGAVVPKRNYAVVHVRGAICIRPESQADAHRYVTELTDHLESDCPNRLQVTDASTYYLTKLVGGFVAFGISVSIVTKRPTDCRERLGRRGCVGVRNKGNTFKLTLSRILVSEFVN